MYSFDPAARYVYITYIGINESHNQTVPDNFGWWSVVLDTWDNTLVRVAAEDPSVRHSRHCQISIAEGTPLWDCAVRDARAHIYSADTNGPTYLRASDYDAFRRLGRAWADAAVQYARSLSHADA